MSCVLKIRKLIKNNISNDNMKEIAKILKISIKKLINCSENSIDSSHMNKKMIDYQQEDYSQASYYQ